MKHLIDNPQFLQDWRDEVPQSSFMPQEERSGTLLHRVGPVAGARPSVIGTPTSS